MDVISADAKHFPKIETEFQKEMLKQAQELYGGRPDTTLDHKHIKRGMEMSPDAPEDNPDFLTHML